MSTMANRKRTAAKKKAPAGPDKDGWFTHDGKSMPCDGGLRVDVTLSGSDGKYRTAKARDLQWRWLRGDRARILSWRPAVCFVCGKQVCECNQGRGASVESATLGGDPVGDLCGSPFSAGALSHAAAAAGGFVMAAIICVVVVSMGWV